MLSRRTFGIGLASACAVSVVGLPALENHARVKVVGFGQSGLNVVDAMTRDGIGGFEYVAVGTDADAVRNSLAPARLLLAPGLVVPSVGKRNVDLRQLRPLGHPDRERLAAALVGADLVLLVGSLTIGSGAGLAALVTDVARTLGAAVVAVATIQGSDRRGRQAAHAVRGLTALGVPIISWPTDRLVRYSRPDRRVMPDSAVAEHELRIATQAIVEVAPHMIAHMQAESPLRAGVAFAGTDSATRAEADCDEDVGRIAAERAIRTPLVHLEAMLATAPWVVVNVSCSERFEGAATAAVVEVQRVARRRAKCIVGRFHDEALGDEVRVTLIAGGADVQAERTFWKRRLRASAKTEVWTSSADLPFDPPSTPPEVDEDGYLAADERDFPTRIPPYALDFRAR